MRAPGASSLPTKLVLTVPGLRFLLPWDPDSTRSPARSPIPVRCGHRSRVRVADGEHVDTLARGCRGLVPAAARTRPAPLRSISGPRGRRPHAEVPLVLSEWHVPARVPGACRGRAPAGSGAAWARLLALEVRIAVQGERHRHVGAVQLVPAPRQAAEAADTGPRHAGPGARRSGPRAPGRTAPARRPRPRGPPRAAAAPPPGLGEAGRGGGGLGDGPAWPGHARATEERGPVGAEAARWVCEGGGAQKRL